MKKLKIVYALLLVMMLFLSGCGASTNKNEDADKNAEQQEVVDNNVVEDEIDWDLYPYDYSSPQFFTIENCWNYAPVATISGVVGNETPFQLNAEDGYAVMQGGCSDGTYAYLLLANPEILNAQGQKDAYCILYKVDLTTWTVVGKSAPLAVDHGNGLTYNPHTKQLMVAHCKNQTQVFSYIDPNTLAVTGSKSLGKNFYAITYSATHDKYVIGIKGTNNFVIYDSAFNSLGEYEGVDPAGLSYQSLFCDDDYIYITYTGDQEAIVVYNWYGQFCGTYKVNAPLENEAMFQAGEDYYMTFYNGGRAGGKVYKLEFNKDLMY